MTGTCEEGRSARMTSQPDISGSMRVEDEQRRPLSRGDLQGAAPVEGGQNTVAILLQVRLDDLDDVHVVVDDQNLLFHSPLSTSVMSAV